MNLFSREWSDTKTWVMGILSALIVAAIVGLFSIERGNVVLSVARSIEQGGRCVDKELFLENNTNLDALDITIDFSVDYFTSRGDVAINIGDEKEQFITSAMQTLLDRQPFIAIPHVLDEKNSIVSIPRLKPGQYIHLFYRGDTVYNVEAAEKRSNLIRENNAPELMSKPRVISSSYKDGKVKIDVVIEC